MQSTVAIVSLLTLALCSTSLPPQEFLHSAFLDHDAKYRMLWTPTEEDITIEVQVATSGYVGLGFSPSGGMTGADMVIGWVDDLGNAQLHDLYGIGNTQPRLDISQDYTLNGGYQNYTHTVLRFSRPWTTCDEDHDLQLDGDTTRVIWSFSDVDPKDIDVLSYHAMNRGTKSIYLQEPRLQEAFNEDLQYWDVKSPSVELPGHLDTLFWCRLFKIPTLKKKNHIIGFEPVIQPASNFKYVHHMILYQCHIENSDQVFEKFVVAKGTQCFTPNMPLSWKKCRDPLAAWSVGSEGLFLPDHVGLPLGEEHGGANYFMLEVHYDNPFLDQGIVDTSGLRIYHTDHLREIDAGVLAVGSEVDNQQIIPPGVKKWSSFGFCSSDCTKSTLPSTGINITNGLLHAHVLGRSISMKQIRNGNELPTILKDNSYDYNYQEHRSLRPELTVLPGDFLIAECSYDSSMSEKTTFGGLSNREEMCVIFLTYYPKANIGRCESIPSYDTIMEPLGIYGFYHQEGGDQGEIDQEKENQQVAAMLLLDTDSSNAIELSLGERFKNDVINNPPGLSNLSFYDILIDKSTWTRDRLTNFQDAVKMGEHDIYCWDANLNPVTAVPVTVTYPVFEPYIPAKPICNTITQEPVSPLSPSFPNNTSFFPLILPSTSPKPVTSPTLTSSPSTSSSLIPSPSLSPQITQNSHIQISTTISTASTPYPHPLSPSLLKTSFTPQSIPDLASPITSSGPPPSPDLTSPINSSSPPLSPLPTTTTFDPSPSPVPTSTVTSPSPPTSTPPITQTNHIHISPIITSLPETIHNPPSPIKTSSTSK